VNRDSLAREQDGRIGAAKGRDRHKQSLGIHEKGAGADERDVHRGGQSEIAAELTVGGGQDRVVGDDFETVCWKKVLRDNAFDPIACGGGERVVFQQGEGAIGV